MRCCYMSDLHLEAQDFPWALPQGDVLIVAGDLCHAYCFTAPPSDLYAARQRERVRRFADEAVAKFAHVLMIAGNHEHYDGVFEDTVPALRQHLPGFMVLDDNHVDIGAVRFFGATLWAGFDGGDPAAMETARRGVGDYFFVRSRARWTGEGKLPKLRPADTLAAHARGLAALEASVSSAAGNTMVVITHHAPSRQGLNPRFAGGGLDGSYASDLDGLVSGWPGPAHWVHGHTHIRHRYRMGETEVLVNCRGLQSRDPVARVFKPAWLEL